MLVKDAFQPIPVLISCTEVTGRWGLLSHAQNAVRYESGHLRCSATDNQTTYHHVHNVAVHSDIQSATQSLSMCRLNSARHHPENSAIPLTMQYM